MIQTLRSSVALGDVVPNIATMLIANAQKFGEKNVFCEKNKNNTYEGILWKQFYDDVRNISCNLKNEGVNKGDKVVLFCPNSLNMLKAEMALMSSGAIAVPIFAFFKKNTAELLITHSDAKFLIADGNQQISQIGNELNLQKIWTFDNVTHPGDYVIRNFSDLLIPAKNGSEHKLNTDALPDDICLNMYTSGTMGIPKCVQLTHKNILSQQASIQKILNVTPDDRFLSYLPWHHSFGGIFELFTALYNGATYFLESSYGKDVKSIFENWKQVKPTVFFSVPKVYQSLFELSVESKEAENTFFNSGLKFIFTAAAALPKRLSDEFEKRGIAVIEGWGLTETSPCCTLTDPSLKREPGVVGLPIPGVEIRIAEDHEIQVKGPNVMVSYYKNDEANTDAFTDDGWYKTGDVGEITPTGLKLITRKDRIFKLSNGEKVIPSDLEKAIELHCHYVQYVIVSGSGEEYPVALIFPNKTLLNQHDREEVVKGKCACPKSLEELGNCLSGCLHTANESIGQKFSKIRAAAVIGEDLSLETNTLTPSMKVAPNNVIEKYRNHLLALYGNHVPLEEEVFLVQLNTNHNI
ncbi:MAG: AMP-binding protein [Bacteroidia bacterium]|nr:AMP-binding protein [Bacteroidia bacterium]